MRNYKKHKVEESFKDFLDSSRELQKGPESLRSKISLFEDEDEIQEELPFEFERRPEIAEETNPTVMRLEKMADIANAGVNKANTVSTQGYKVDPYINRQLDLAYKHLREAYLRLMDMK
jgi:hypothetical protein